jgi:hypothetical protein
MVPSITIVEDSSPFRDILELDWLQRRTVLGISHDEAQLILYKVAVAEAYATIAPRVLRGSNERREWMYFRIMSWLEGF